MQRGLGPGRCAMRAWHGEATAQEEQGSQVTPREVQNSRVVAQQGAAGRDGGPAHQYRVSHEQRTADDEGLRHWLEAVRGTARPAKGAREAQRAPHAAAAPPVGA
jgi:hypothetical protein